MNNLSSYRGLIDEWTSRASGRKAMQARLRRVAMAELAIYVHTMTIFKLCRHNLTQSTYFMIFFVSSISYRPTTDLSLLKEFSKNVSF